MQFLLVFIGGGLGACTRHFINILTNQFLRLHLFFGTLFANILGCLILGCLTYLFIKNANLSKLHKLLLVTGYCGGLTTFSSFVFDFLKLLQAGETLIGISYLIASVVLSILTFIFGFYLIKIFV